MEAVDERVGRRNIDTRRRRSGRRRSLRYRAPLVLACVTAFVVVEPFNGGVASQAAHTVLAGTIGGILFAAIVLLDAYGERLSSTLTWVRPRWQYVLFALCYASPTVIGALEILRYRQGWLANVAAALVVWSSAAALAMVGRAASWGRVRRAFWWHPPQWLASEG